MSACPAHFRECPLFVEWTLATRLEDSAHVAIASHMTPIGQLGSLFPSWVRDAGQSLEAPLWETYKFKSPHVCEEREKGQRYAE